MEIRVSESALKFFKSEFEVDEDEGIRLKGTIDEESVSEDVNNVPDKSRTDPEVEHETMDDDANFSVSLQVAKPRNPIVETTVDGLLIFVEQEDEWFAEGKDLEIDFKNEEPIYEFVEA